MKQEDNNPKPPSTRTRTNKSASLQSTMLFQNEEQDKIYKHKIRKSGMICNTNDIFKFVSQVISKDSKILSQFSNGICLKIIASSNNCFKNFNPRKQFLEFVKPDQNVLCKVYDFYQSKYLHLEQRQNITRDYDESELNILSSIKDKDWESIYETIITSFLREFIALKRIEDWNSSRGKVNQINTPKLLQYCWLHDFWINRDNTFYGPILIFENFEFINDNKINNIRREHNFARQIKLLKLAGIDLERHEFCFDENDECFFIDFGLASVDNDENFNKFDLDEFIPENH
ncbi:hypothetical protein BN7_5029 [Wickerhamomyces ciferrii]|uniref:Uncharacterized protein n=1 Tax=Wickerhamomyces ciferrii (strain ATCC 14091 / BCRC 22168 / CBS 111 / JCM 3599 / NBRC 0793 / NRRL Y-1031 F-60-10) TaxID=1206466 RepID=K0KTU8_WICCF|nr:uncharacterized protein BN7_5029 [Wickerhamomyces ciferrii]CCH45447.1 hypothetical protein BN7_5029 [Wickerhamomyces ciferrii]